MSTKFCVNLAPTATASMESGTAATGYAVTNLNDEFADSYLKTTSPASIVIQLYFGSAQALDFMGIINHNFSGGTLEVRSHSSDNFAAATVRATRAVPANPLTHPCCYAIWNSASAQYWWLNLTGSGGSVTSADNFLKIGELVCGALTAFTKQPAPINEVWKKDSIIHKMKSGREYVVRRGQRREFRLDFPTIQLDDLDQLDELYLDLDGPATPFAIVLNTSRAAADAKDIYYGRLLDTMEVRHTSEDIYDVSLDLVEESFE